MTFLIAKVKELLPRRTSLEESSNLAFVAVATELLNVMAVTFLPAFPGTQASSSKHWPSSTSTSA